MKRLYIFCLLFFVSTQIFSQVAIEWQKAYGGNGTDQLFSTLQTNDGGFILGGRSNSNISGDKTESCQGGFDYWIVKTDAFGNKQWEKTIGGSGDDFLRSIDQSTDGGYILGGFSNSNISGDKTENCIGMDDYWIVKTDTLGNIQWQNTIGGSYTDKLSCIKQISDGGYILGGYSESNISGDKTENSLGGLDFWVVKIDSLGNLLWQKTIGGSGLEALESLQQTADGGFILGGKTTSYTNSDEYWIVKIDASGNFQWEKLVWANKNDILKIIQQTSDGGYIMGGYSNSDISGDKTEVCQGNYDYWIVKTDSLGNIQWQNTIGGISGEILNSLQQTTDGGYILAGSSSSDISGDKTENNKGITDYWIIKTDATGNLLWQKTIGGDNLDELIYIQQSADGSYILGGYSGSSISGDKTEYSRGLEDFWIIKVRENFNTITGKIFIDSNSNAIHDVGEPVAPNYKIHEVSTNRFGISGSEGYYYLLLNDTGNFTVFPAQPLHYTFTPLIYSVNFSAMQLTDSLNDFALQPNGIINDLQVTINPIGAFRPGFNAHYNIHYKNIGTTSISGSVIFKPDSILSYISSTTIPTSVTPDSVIWNLSMINPFDEGNILVTVNVSTLASNGSVINSLALIEPIAGDTTPLDNESTWPVIVTGSFDPNDILVSRETIINYEFASPPYLDYLIRFQNTGTDTAFTVKIKNPLPVNAQLNTIEFINSSHPVQLNYNNDEQVLWFQFDNILLPDSNTNELLSHGFVRYRIKPKSTLVVGDLIENSASIFFDFNAPVVTNTAVTEIVPPNVPTITPSNLILCPNESDTLWTQVYDSYQWYKDGNIIPGATQQFLVVDYFNDSGYYFYVEVDSAGFFETSDSVLVDGWVFLPPFVIQSGDFTIGSMGEMIICPGDTAFLILGNPYDTNIQWTDNGNIIPGATNDTLMVTQGGLYHVTGSPAVCPNFVQGLFDDITVVVQGPPTPVITLTGNNLSTQSGYTYQWYLNGNPIAGSSNTIPVQGMGSYTVTITDNNGCSETSAPFIVTSIIESLQSGTVSVIYNNGLLQISRSITNYEEEIFVLDITGRIVVNTNLAKGISQTEIQLHHINTGIYFVKINDAATVKFFVE